MQQNGRIDTGAEALIDAIRGEADERISAIDAQADQELRTIDDEHAAIVASLTRELEAAAQLQIAKECSRIRHKAEIEAKKLRLVLLDAFISQMIARALARLVTERRQDYRLLLARHAGEALARIACGTAVIHLSPDDFEKDGQALLRTLAAAQQAATELQLVADRAIGAGGCSVEHIGQGVSYIATVDEAVKRNSNRIRSEALKLIKTRDHSISSMKGQT